MLLKRKEFCVSPFLNKGSIIMALIITMLFFSVLALVMFSLMNTSIFGQLNTASTTKANYIAKSGYNYLASVYKNAATEVTKNLALENLNGVNFQLLNNNGSFLLNVEPSYLRSTDLGTNGMKTITNADGLTLLVKFPGAVSYTIPSSAANKLMAVYTTAGWRRFYYTTVTTLGANNYQLNLSSTNPPDGQPLTIGIGQSVVPVLALASNQTLTNGGNLNVAAGTGAIFPAHFGFFEIPRYTADPPSRVYYYDHRTGDTLFNIRDANTPSRVFSYALTSTVPTGTGMIFAHTSAAITSTGTFNTGLGQAVTPVSNTFSRTAILGFKPGGNSDNVQQNIPGVDAWVAFGGGTNGPGIAINTGTEVISIGQNLNDTAGVAWYAGNSDAANCAAGVCDFGIGIRAYFEFADSATGGRGDGFMFIIMNGILNDTTKRGGTVSGALMGELMGYAGPGNTADGLGLQPPKLSIEFDRYNNPGVSTPAGCGNGRNDAAGDHMALMLWGDNTAGNCANGLPAASYDDNVHSAGVAYPTVGYNTAPINSATGDGTGGYYATSFANTTTREFRMEVIRAATPNVRGNYDYNVKAWIDCAACDDVTLQYTASTPQINRTIELTPALHTNFNKMIFGFTQGTGSATQNITISNFDIYFPGSCNYSINPTSLTVPRAASTGTIAVYMSGGCAWTAVSNAGWLTITAGASGAGSGTINYSYTVNNGTARTGTITVTGAAGTQTFTLTQTNP